MNTKELKNILQQINLLDEYEQKSLAIILMKLTLNDYQNDINQLTYKQLIKNWIN